jgi:ribose 5-phosphate isomerase A
MPDVTEVKRALGNAAVDRFVRDGMRVGLGTGSTAIWAVRRVAARLAEGTLHDIRVVATSLQTDLEARGLGIPVLTLNDKAMAGGLDLTIDGADEVDPQRHLIKGGGGALLLEKIIAYCSRRFVIIVDDGKLSSRLGEHFPVPVEAVAQGLAPVMAAIRALGGEPVVRTGAGKAGPVVTDLGNLLLDVSFKAAFAPAAMEDALKLIPGVLDNGLFTKIRPELLVGRADGSIEHRGP